MPTNQVSALSNPGWYGTYAYDAAGNVTWDGVHNYQYDAENRMVSVDGGATASYTYDHQNRRYKKTVGSTVTHYVWQGGQVLAEHNGGTGGVITDYVYSGSRMIANVSGGTTQYFLSDRLSTRLVLDASGNVIGRQGHLPFGEDFGESGSQEKHHFTSYERDAAMGLDLPVTRQYSSNTGEFTSVDQNRPSASNAYPQSWNRYSYVQNDPINGVDPLGSARCELWGTFSIFSYGGTIIAAFLLNTFTVCKGGDSTPGDEKGPGGGAAQKTAALPGNLRARLDKLLRKKNNECGNFVQNLINQVAKDTGKPFYSDNAQDLFDIISGPGGGGYVLSKGPLQVSGRRAGGTVAGSIGNIGVQGATPPTVIISPETYFNLGVEIYRSHMFILLCMRRFISLPLKELMMIFN